MHSLSKKIQKSQEKQSRSYSPLSNKKAQLAGLGEGATSFIITAVILAISATILFTIATNQGTTDCVGGFWNSTSNVCQINSTNTSAKLNNTLAFNSSNYGLSSINTFASNMTTLALVFVFSVILFFLGRFLANRGE